MSGSQRGVTLLGVFSCFSLFLVSPTRGQIHPTSLGREIRCLACRVLLQPRAEFRDAEGGGAPPVTARYHPQSTSLQETQQRIELDGPPSCRSCRIIVEKELTMGGIDAPGVGQFSIIARDSMGRFIVSDQAMPDEIGVYDSTGVFLRTIGRKGEGPGEWRMVGRIAAMGGKLIVIDIQNARETVLDSNFNVIRTTPLVGNPLDLVILSDSVKVANMLINSPELVGHPLHTIDRDGRIKASFGFVQGVFRLDSQSERWRKLSASSDGTIWAGHSREYLIEKWTPTGEKLLTIERSVKWFPPMTQKDSWSPDRAPDPRMAATFEDADGHLWVAVSVADPEWKEALTPIEGGAFQAVQSEYLDYMVEVIDPHSGQVLAGMRLDRVGPFIGGGRMAVYRQDDGGLPYQDIYKIRLDRGERRER